VVKSTGDGVLVEFPSAHDAVDWAQQVQHHVAPKQLARGGASWRYYKNRIRRFR
jgi:hypothetical protein